MVTSLALALAGCGARSDREKYLAKGNQLFEQHRFEEASINYRKAIQADPNFGPGHYRLALAEARLNHPDRYFASLVRASTLMPADEDVRARLGEFYLGRYQATHSGTDYEKTRQIADFLLSRNVHSFQGLRLNGYLAFASGKTGNAIDFFSRADAEQANVPDVVTTLVQALFLDGRGEEAERLGSGLITAHPDFAPIYDTLYSYYRSKGRVRDAERVLLTAVERNPADSLPIERLAQHYWRLKQPAEAGRVLERLLRDTTNFPRAYLDVGDFYLKNGNADQAVKFYEAGAGAHPKDRLTYEKRVVQALLLEDNRSVVLERLTTLLREYPEDPDLRGTRATLLVDSPRKQERTEALGELQKLSTEQPDNVSFNYQLGRAYVADEQYGEARRRLERVATLQPENATVWLALAEVSSKLLDYAACQRYAGRALNVNPKLRSARLLQASSLVGLGDLKAARLEYNHLIEEYPDYREARLQRGLLDIIDGRYADAEREFRADYEPARGDFRAVKGLIEMYFSQGDVDRAFALLQRQVSQYPSSLELRGAEAAAAARAGKWDLAIREYLRMSAEKPDDGGIWLALGEAYRHAGDAKNSGAALERAASLRPHDWRAPFLLGYVYQMSGLRSQAEAQYAKCLQLNPDFPDALNNLAFLIAEENSRLEEALTLAQRAVQASHESPQSSDTLGWIYLKQGHLDAARQIFTRLVKQSPDNPMLHYHLGLVLHRQGQRAQANAELETALRGKLPESDRSLAAQLVSFSR